MTEKNVTQFAIPLLPCISINETENFYKALGAVVTYKQKAPNNYIGLSIKDIEVHFFALKPLVPASNYSTCYLVVTDIDPFYEACRTALKTLYGKIPLKGIPRINPLKDMPSNGVRQFIIVDPNGNYIRIGQRIEKTDSLIFRENNKAVITGTPLAKAYESGSRLADAKGDFTTAASVLDKALASADTTDTLNLIKVLILRADISLRLSETDRFNELIKATEAQLAVFPATEATEERRLLKELKAGHS
ncbi:VOC family protein [Niastella caeni]|uniref:VOC family protein n=1 Tax=Niastella caeni TaxID=2569763 RepID=A0A4S8HSX6_9BACT|nr:VOC family protein [Niastella caeni]THU38111.1 VOC family protein [Niastella caeni]